MRVLYPGRLVAPQSSVATQAISSILASTHLSLRSERSQRATSSCIIATRSGVRARRRRSLIMTVVSYGPGSRVGWTRNSA